jgi:microcystin degradation protein MlrC
LDGVLVAPHGAAVSEDQEDLDGHWLSLVREHARPRVPIICTLDLHANLSKRMVAACDAIIAYRTNPHLDQRQRGIEAASLLARTIRGEIRPTMAAAFPPMAINIERQLTAESPCADLYALADEQLLNPKVLSNSVLLGFPYADVAEMGASFVAVTNGDQPLAQHLADELARYALAHREDFVGRLVSVTDALRDAADQHDSVCLLDMGDNVGGGSPGDGTVLIHAIHEQQLGPAVACIYDPPAVALAQQAGVGASVTLSIGGKTDRLHGNSLVAQFRVTSLHDGKFHEADPRHGGRTVYDMGQTAVVQTHTGLTLVLNSLRTPPFSLGQLTSCGLDPARFQILVAKGVHAPVAAYRSVCRRFIRVNTPGVTTADMTNLSYRNRRRPLFPFEPLESV